MRRQRVERKVFRWLLEPTLQLLIGGTRIHRRHYLKRLLQISKGRHEPTGIGQTSRLMPSAHHSLDDCSLVQGCGSRPEASAAHAAWPRRPETRAYRCALRFRRPTTPPL